VATEELLEARTRLDGVIARHLQALDIRQVTVAECGRSIRAWLVEEQHLSGSDAQQRMMVARGFVLHRHVETSLLAGDIGHDMARIIVGCLRKLNPQWAAAAEPELIATARDHGHGALIELCRVIRVRTGADENAEAAAQRQYSSRWVTLTPTFAGTSVSGMLDPESAATLTAALAPLLVRTVEDDRTPAQRCADGLVELARLAMAHRDLPDHGGEHPQVVVTLPFGELRDGIGRGETGHATIYGRPVTPQTARRIACDANLIPAVLGARSEVLDLGRTTPTWNTAQRRARRLEDQGCTWPRCTTDLSRCRPPHQPLDPTPRTHQPRQRHPPLPLPSPPHPSLQVEPHPQPPRQDRSLANLSRGPSCYRRTVVRASVGGPDE
jgi:Domain of unknown function (DUF222)